MSGDTTAATTAADADTFAEYAASRDDARFTDWLRERSEPAWSDATDHRFTQELGAGTLDDAVIAEYLRQDYAFVGTLIGVFGYAVGDAPTMADRVDLPRVGEARGRRSAGRVLSLGVDRPPRKRRICRLCRLAARATRHGRPDAVSTSSAACCSPLRADG